MTNNSINRIKEALNNCYEIIVTTADGRACTITPDTRSFDGRIYMEEGDDAWQVNTDEELEEYLAAVPEQLWITREIEGVEY